MQRADIVSLLEESGMHVMQCESAEDALSVLDKFGDCLTMLFTDVNLAGRMDGIELAYIAKRLNPNIHLVVTSGNTLTKDLPDGALFLPKPWLPLDDCRRRNAATSSNQEARCGTESVNVIAVGGHQQISLSPRNHSDAMAALRGG